MNHAFQNPKKQLKLENGIDSTVTKVGRAGHHSRAHIEIHSQESFAIDDKNLPIGHGRPLILIFNLVS